MPIGTAPEPVQDGRRRKGLRRRQQLLAATMRVIAADGVAAVSQRAVARAAGLPPSAVTYYFPTVDSLLVATLRACNDSYLQRLAGFADDHTRALAQLAELIAGSADPDRARVAAEYELYLLAARRPDLRAELDRWTRALDGFVARFVTDPVRRAGVTAAVDGLFLRCFCAARPPDAAEVLGILRALTGLAVADRDPG
ncbi:MAG: TetR family transcriptional regulator [Micromonosporaceae bacterium]|nr:TetR family transcriptional regulator [Micromonosporaceae bacterium]